MPGGLEFDPEQQADGWIYEFAGDYLRQPGPGVNFNPEYIKTETSEGPDGEELVMTISIHYHRAQAREECGWCFTDSRNASSEGNDRSPASELTTQHDPDGSSGESA